MRARLDRLSSWRRARGGGQERRILADFNRWQFTARVLNRAGACDSVRRLQTERRRAARPAARWRRWQSAHPAHRLINPMMAGRLCARAAWITAALPHVDSMRAYRSKPEGLDPLLGCLGGALRGCPMTRQSK